MSTEKQSPGKASDSPGQTLASALEDDSDNSYEIVVVGANRDGMLPPSLANHRWQGFAKKSLPSSVGGSILIVGDDRLPETMSHPVLYKRVRQALADEATLDMLRERTYVVREEKPPGVVLKKGLSRRDFRKRMRVEQAKHARLADTPQAGGSRIERHQAALIAAGFSPDTTELLRGWIEHEVEARMSQFVGGEVQPRVFTRNAVGRYSAEDLAALLKPSEFAGALGVGQDELTSLENEGQFFSVYRSGDGRAQAYPAFQLWPSVSGQGLRTVLSLLGDLSGSAKFSFFVGDDLNISGLSPVELLLGAPIDKGGTGLELGGRSAKLLGLDTPERLDRVLYAARLFARKHL